jgi:hypothetical protein
VACHFPVTEVERTPQGRMQAQQAAAEIPPDTTTEPAL